MTPDAALIVEARERHCTFCVGLADRIAALTAEAVHAQTCWEGLCDDLHKAEAERDEAKTNLATVQRLELQWKDAMLARVEKAEHELKLAQEQLTKVAKGWATIGQAHDDTIREVRAERDALQIQLTDTYAAIARSLGYPLERAARRELKP